MSEKTPIGWAHCLFGDIAYLKNGCAFKSKSYLTDGIPVIRISDIQDGVVTSENAVKVKANKEFERFSVLNGDVLIAMSGATTGKFGIYKSGKYAYQNQRVGNIKPRSKDVFKNYVFYFLYSAKKEIEKLAYGGAQPNISAEKIEGITFDLPPVNEQHRIVAKIEELFSELDKGIESLKTAREQLKVYRQAVLKHAFEGKLTARWREENKGKLETADQLLARIQKERKACYQQQIMELDKAVKVWEADGKRGRKPSKSKKPKKLPTLSTEELARLPQLPSGFVYTNLGNLGNLGRGKSKQRPRNDPQLFGGSYPFIQTGEVKAARRIVRKYSQTYNETGLLQSKLWPKGTLCITIAANIAETAFLGFDACFPDSVVGFSAVDRLVMPEYIELFIKAVRVRIEAYAPATAQKNINLTTLENLVVPLCSMEEQRFMINEIQAILSVIDDNEDEIEANLNRTEALRQSILKKAFSGQLVAQDPGDEPAAVLLERIKAEKVKQAPKKKVHRRKAVTNSTRRKKVFT